MREAFEEIVRRDLGDVPVMGNGRYISPKINNYWRVWQAATERAAKVCEDYGTSVTTKALAAAIRKGA